MQQRQHILAIVDGTPGGEAPLDIAHRAVEQGGRATVLVLISNEDRNHIRALADSENLSVGEAEAIYIDRTIELFTARVGGDETSTVVSGGLRNGRAALEAASRVHATAVAVPRELAARRAWRNAFGRAPMAVVITPPRVA